MSSGEGSARITNDSEENGMSQGIDVAAITERQKETWGAAGYQSIANQVVDVGEALLDAMDPGPAQRVLDVACGTGNAALGAARRACDVVGLDYVPAMIERARARAEADGLAVRFEVGDAQALPYSDAEFDAVLSVFGSMFAPDQERAASELLRVLKPGGVLGLVTWPPHGYAKDFLALHAEYAPPPPELESPFRWGTEAGLEELMGDGVSSTVRAHRTTRFYGRSVEDLAWEYRRDFGPTVQTFAGLPEEKHGELFEGMVEVLERHNRATDGTAVVEAEYVLTVGVREG